MCRPSITHLCGALILTITILLLYFLINTHPTIKQFTFNTTTPKINQKQKVHIPKFMLELFERNQKNHNSERADVVRSLIPKHASSPLIELSEEKHLLVFDLPSSGMGERFVDAELRILTVVETKSGIERQLQVSLYNDEDNSLKSLEKVHIYHFNNTWLSFNLTGPVVKILESHQQKSLKLVISIRSFLNGGTFRLSMMPLGDDYNHEYPILLLSYTSQGKLRKKRSLEEDYEEETNRIWNEESKTLQLKKQKRLKNSCKRRPLYINFSEIEYDLWIVQPVGYEAYQCLGKCFYPVADHLNPTKHAIVQALLHSVSPSKVPRSCCVPTLLDSISILYVDPHGVLTYRYAYQDMVVSECGCR